MDTPIVPAERMEFEVFARVCDLHPDMLDRWVTLGLVEVVHDDDGVRWLERHQVRSVDRVRRLRAGLRLSYSAIAVVAPLIDRLDELEEELVRLRAERDVALTHRGNDTSRPTGGSGGATGW